MIAVCHIVRQEPFRVPAKISSCQDPLPYEELIIGIFIDAGRHTSLNP